MRSRFRWRVLWPLALASLLVVCIALLGFTLGAWDSGRGQHSVAAALLVATGTACAACVAALVWEYKAQLDREVKETEESRLRRERVRDVVLAIEADVKSDLELLNVYTDEKIAEDIRRFDARVAEGDEKPLPRSEQSTKRIVLGAIEKDITILPGNLIGSVVNYYEKDLDLGAILEAFSSGKYDSLTPERQRELLVGYYSLLPQARKAAMLVVQEINQWLRTSSV